MSRSGAPVLVRAAAALVAALLSAPAFAALGSVEVAPCCRPASAPMGCCAGALAPVDAAADCCLLTAPEGAAPLLRPAAPTLEAPLALGGDEAVPPRAASLEGPERLVAPRARSAPLFLLFAALLV